MSLPKQVRQTIDEAKRIEEELRRQRETPAEAPPPAEAQPMAEAQPPEETPAPPAASSEPIEVSAPPPPEPPATPTVPKSDYDQLAHQYRTLQGIHRSLVQARTELEQRVVALTRELEAVKQQQSTPPPQTQSLTKEEIEEYGPDLIGVIERKAQEVAAPLHAQVRLLTERNQFLENSLRSVSQVQATSAEEAFVSGLARLVPDWETTNYDPNFLAWLDLPNPFSVNESRKQTLDRAVAHGDFRIAASFFTAFKAESGNLQPSSSAPAAQPTPTRQPVQVPPLESQAAPAQRSAPDQTAQARGKIWTQQEVGRFYQDVTNGKYRLNPQEKQRIEREIFTAQKENRIAA